MENDGNLIWRQLQMLLLFLERPMVEYQIGSIILTTLVAWGISAALWRGGRPRFYDWVDALATDRRRQVGQGLATLIEQIAFPALNLLLLPLTISILQVQGILTNLLSGTLEFFWIFLIYRLVIALLYIFIGKQQVRPYHDRILAPLFWIVFTMVVVGVFINLQELANLQLFILFDDPLTLVELFTIVVALYFLLNIAKAAQEILQTVIVPRVKADPGVLNAMLTISRYVVIFVGSVIIFGGLGFDPTSLALIGSGLSIGIGFGLQTIISNFISGIVLLFEQSLRPGDVIEVEGVMGTVERLSIRSTTVRTFDNIEMIIPNETLLTSTVTTFTHASRTTRILMTIGVSYDSNPKDVMDILLAAAQEHGLVLDDPKPAAFFENYGDSSIDFHLAIWVNEPEHRKRVPSDLRLIIWKEFEKRGIEIPFPQRDLHIRSGLLTELGEKAEVKAG